MNSTKLKEMFILKNGVWIFLFLFFFRIPTDIRDAAFCVGVRESNTTESWEQMFNLYTTTQSPSEKQSAQAALACTENRDLLSRYHAVGFFF